MNTSLNELGREKMTTSLNELETELRHKCNEFVNGVCRTRACILRYNKSNKYDNNLATCEAKEQYMALINLRREVGI